MWLYNKKDEIWRIQTDEPHVIRKLQKRPNAWLVAKAINSRFRIFHLIVSSRFKALLSLSRLTGRECFFMSSEEVILTKNAPILDIKNKSETSK